MSSILTTAKLSTQAGGRPPSAVEVTPDGVLAAALHGAGEAPVYAYQALPPGTLIAGIGEPNLRSPETVSAAIRKALDEVSPRKRAVTLVLPDTLVRVFMLDFDSLPVKAEEALPVLRFRLRKMVPFDVEHAGISYQVLSHSKSECKVLTAVLPGPILAEYEAAVRAAGYEPGAALPSSLAALEVMDGMEAVLAANLSRQALTTTIANGQDLLLYRTLDLPDDETQRTGEIRRGIAVAAAYFEDRLQMRPRQLHYAGSPATDQFAEWVGDPELAVVDLAPRGGSGALTALGSSSLAGVTGALVGAG